MGSQPSPVIPFLMVAVLGFLVHGWSVIEDISIVSDHAEDTAFTLILVVPLVILLLIYFTSQSLVLPLAILLITYVISKMILGPLFLILIIYFLSVYAPSFDGDRVFRGFSNSNSNRRRSGGGGDEYGWGCVLLFVVFLALHGMFSQGGSYWGLVILAVLFFVFTNFNCSYPANC